MLTIIFKTGETQNKDGKQFKSKRKNAKLEPDKLCPQNCDEDKELYSQGTDNTGGLAVAGGMIVVVGYAMVLNMMYIKYLLPFFFAGFILAGYLNFSLLAFGALGLIIAVIYVQLNPNFAKNTGQVVVSGVELADDELED